MNVEQLRSLDEKCLTSADLGLLANLKTVWDVKISWETPYESCEILWSFFSENQKIKSICLRNGWDIKEIFLLSHRLSVLCNFRKPLVERCDEVKKHNPYWIEETLDSIWASVLINAKYFTQTSKSFQPLSIPTERWSLAQRPYAVSIT